MTPKTRIVSTVNENTIDNKKNNPHIINDVSEINLVNITVTIPMPKVIKAALRSRHRIMAREHATPFPPLNLSCTGKLCPSTTPSPPYSPGNREALFPKNVPPPLKSKEQTTYAKTAFKMSKTNVTAPAFAPRVLSTFVVPALPLPCSLISILPYHLET